MNSVFSQQRAVPFLPLVLAKSGKKLKISSIGGGDQTRSHLANLGLFPDEEVQILSHSKSGPLLVMVKGCRLALGRDLSRKIMVAEKDDLS